MLSRALVRTHSTSSFFNVGTDSAKLGPVEEFAGSKVNAMVHDLNALVGQFIFLQNIRQGQFRSGVKRTLHQYHRCPSMAYFIR